MNNSLLPVLGNPLFRRYVLGNGSSLLGLWVQRVGLGWLTWELTHSGFWLGAIAFADLSPALVIGPFAGVWADRYDRRSILLATQSVSSVIALLLFLLVFYEAINVYVLFGLSLGLGIAASIAQPARLALVPSLVKPQDMSSAVALNSVIFNSARFVGPMIAGGLIALGDVSLTFLFNGLTYATMVGVMLTIPRGLHATKNNGQHILKDILDGLRYTAGHDVIRPLILIILALAVVAKPVAELLPGFADRVFAMGAVGLALMTQAMGVGALTGGLWLARISRTSRLPSITLTAFPVCGLMVCGFALTTNFTVGLTFLFFVGMLTSMTGICTQTLVQHAVEDAMRGRVLSLWGLIFRGAPSIGVVVMGAISEITSLGTVVLGAGILCLMAAGFALRWKSRLKSAFTS